MTDQPKPRRTRRRFLADMLFLGGGLTATALLAKTQIAGATPKGKPTPATTPQTASTPVENPPDIAGEMVAPEAPNPAGGRRAPVNKPECPPDIDGDVALPEAEPSPRPQVEGKVVQPEVIQPMPGAAPMRKIE